MTNIHDITVLKELVLEILIELPSKIYKYRLGPKKALTIDSGSEGFMTIWVTIE